MTVCTATVCITPVTIIFDIRLKQAINRSNIKTGLFTCGGRLSTRLESSHLSHSCHVVDSRQLCDSVMISRLVPEQMHQMLCRKRLFVIHLTLCEMTIQLPYATRQDKTLIPCSASVSLLTATNSDHVDHGQTGRLM